MKSNSKRIRLITILVWIVFAALSHGAWLEWEHSKRYEGLGLTAGYRVLVGTKSGVYGVTNDVGRTNVVSLLRLRLFPVLTNYFVVTAYDSNGRETKWSEEVDWGRASLSVAAPRTNVVLRIPSGKFYVESSSGLAAWASKVTVTGPTNISLPIGGTTGFIRYRPYFVSAVNPKSGKLPAKAVAFKKKPKPTVHNAPIGPVNLDPLKR